MFKPHLVHKARVAAHDDSPARVAGGHAGHVEALLPLLVDPLEREAVADLHRSNAIQRQQQFQQNESWVRATYLAVYLDSSSHIA